MRRVLHVIGGTEVGGTELVLARLVRSLDPAHFESVVVSIRPLGAVGRDLIGDGHRVMSIGVTGAGQLPVALLRLRSVIRRERPDVVQTWIYHADLLGGVAARAAGCRSIVWSVRQGEVSRARNKWTIVWLARACSVASRWVPTRIVFNSEASLEHHVRRGYDEAKAVVIPNGFDTERFRRDDEAGRVVRLELGIPPGVPVVGLIARWDPQKDHANFVRAAAKAAAALDDAVFVIAGPGISWDKVELVRMIDEVGLPHERIRLTGERSDVVPLLSAFDIAVSSSAGEGLPNSVGEAMSIGLHCVATDVGDTAKLLGDAGSLVPPANPEALAGAIVAAATSGVDRRRRVGERARRRVEAHFGLERMIREFASLYEEIATTTRRT